MITYFELGTVGYPRKTFLRRLTFTAGLGRESETGSALRVGPEPTTRTRHGQPNTEESYLSRRKNAERCSGLANWLKLKTVHYSGCISLVNAIFWGNHKTTPVPALLGIFTSQLLN